MFQIFKIKGFSAYLAIVFFNAFIDLGHKIIIQNTIFKTYDGSLQVTLIAIVNALILLPFILLFTPSGFISDKFPKNNVIKITMFLSIPIMILISVCYYFGWFWLAFGLTFLLAIHSVFYSPAKYGYIKELVGKEFLAIGNSFVQSITIIAILLGCFVYSILFEYFLKGITEFHIELILKKIYPLGFILIICAIIQFILSWYLPKKREKEVNQIFDFKKYFRFQYLSQNIKIVTTHESLWRCILGLTVFFGINQVILAHFGAHLKEVADITNTVIIQGILFVGGVGLILGSLYAGKISKHYIETGLIPIGALGVTCALFFLQQLKDPLSLVILFFVYGAFAGFLLVPLNSLIQFYATEEKIGKILAANNFIQNIGMFLFLAFTIIFSFLHFHSTTMFFIIFLIALLGSIYTVFKLPQSLIRYLVRFLISQKYELEVLGLNNFPSAGGVLLLGNHVSWIDWAVLQIASPRKIHFVMERSIYERWYIRWILNYWEVIPISSSMSKESLQKISEYLKKGEVVLLFPEGHITRNGHLGVFKRGFELAVNETNSVIVPFYIRGLWGSLYSYAMPKFRSSSRGKGIRKISVSFGKQLENTVTAAEIKKSVLQLSIYAWQEYMNSLDPLALTWLRTCLKQKRSLCLVDFDGRELSNKDILLGSFLFSAEIKKKCKTEKNIGILLPPGAAGIMANLAVLIRGKTIVNLNYTSNMDVLNKCIGKANIDSIYTSRRFVKKLEAKGFDLEKILCSKKVYFMEDIKEKFSKIIFIRKYLAVSLFPEYLLRLFYFKKTHLDDVAAILFTSGSEGNPKGVQLTHRNIIGNIKQIANVIHFKNDDVMLSSLPLFHAFGLTVTTLFPLIEGIPMVCFPDPTDGLSIGKLVAKYKVTMLFGTSTFLRLYIKNKKIHPLMFKTLRIVVSGAERLSEDVRIGFRERFGLDILEGYGTTETTPVASVNIPDFLVLDEWFVQQGQKQGAVGMPLPGSAFKIVDPETLESLPIGQSGLILIGGTQIMKGYLDEPQKTKNVIIESEDIRWYNTGDKGLLDEDGFLTIQGRYSRFAKIGGEMISLEAVEKAISDVIQNSEIEILAMAMADEKKGEKIVLMIAGNIDTETLRITLQKSEINPLWLPAKIISVPAIPKLGSGKTDFNMAKQICLEKMI